MPEGKALPTSKAIRQIEDRMESLPPGSLRYETLQAAKQFKSSWITLGRMLFTVYSEKKFREWGYLTFEAYCAKEIGVRAATAKKLLHSYYFLEKEEPALLQRLSDDSPTKLPQLDAVNVLRLLKKRQEISPVHYQRFRSYALERGAEAPELRKEVRSFLEEAQPDPAKAREERRKATLKRMIGTLKAMRLEMAASNWVPKKLLTEIEALTQKLEAVL